jgi:hypothetical protein
MSSTKTTATIPQPYEKRFLATPETCMTAPWEE